MMICSSWAHSGQKCNPSPPPHSIYSKGYLFPHLLQQQIRAYVTDKEETNVKMNQENKSCATSFFLPGWFSSLHDSPYPHLRHPICFSHPPQGTIWQQDAAGQTEERERLLQLTGLLLLYWSSLYKNTREKKPLMILRTMTEIRN
jgi:hypothetical protein